MAPAPRQRAGGAPSTRRANKTVTLGVWLSIHGPPDASELEASSQTGMPNRA